MRPPKLPNRYPHPPEIKRPVVFYCDVCKKDHTHLLTAEALRNPYLKETLADLCFNDKRRLK
jgi:hypothetical protein